MTSKATTEFTQAIAEVAQQVWREADGRATIDEMVDRLEQDYREVVDGAITNHRRTILHKFVRDYCRRATEYVDVALASGNGAGLQSVLPGMEPPMAIAVERSDGKYEYVGYYKATWSDLEAGLNTRNKNLERGEASRDDYVDKMDFLRSAMMKNPSITIGQALHTIHSPSKERSSV